MAKEGKKPIGKIVLGIIVVLVIVGAVGSMGGNSTDSSASDSAKPAETTRQAEEQKEPQEPYTIADEAEDTSNQFTYKITGTLTNNTDKEKSYIQIEYVLYDADGQPGWNGSCKHQSSEGGRLLEVRGAGYGVSRPGC